MRLLALTLLAAWPLAGFTTEQVAAPETGLVTWQTETDGIQVRLTQISPDQTRAFYQARGFSPDAAERYARECAFMTVVRNIGEFPIRHNLANWRYVFADQPPRTIRSKVAWEHLWKRQGCPNRRASPLPGHSSPPPRPLPRATGTRA